MLHKRWQLPEAFPSSQLFEQEWVIICYNMSDRQIGHRILFLWKLTAVNPWTSFYWLMQIAIGEKACLTYPLILKSSRVRYGKPPNWFRDFVNDKINNSLRLWAIYRFQYIWQDLGSKNLKILWLNSGVESNVDVLCAISCQFLLKGLVQSYLDA